MLILNSLIRNVRKKKIKRNFKKKSKLKCKEYTQENKNMCATLKNHIEV